MVGKRVFNIVSDLTGLSSFYASSIYKWIVFAAVVVIHVKIWNAVQITSSIKRIFYRIRVWSLFTSSVFIFIFQTIRQKEIGECYKKCVQYPSSCYFNLFLSFFDFVTQLMIYYFFYRCPLFHELFYAFILLIYIQIPSIQFECLIGFIIERTEIINNELEIVNKLSHIGNIVRQEYKAIEELTDSVTFIYSYQILIMITEVFLEMLFVIQDFFFHRIKSDELVDPVLDFVLKCYIVSSLFLKLVIITRSAENYLQQCTRMNFILCRMANSSHDGNYSEIRELMLQKILRPARISVLDLFSLNYELLYKIGCATVNYGMIIGIMYLEILTIFGDIN